jgi:Zn2+/Cd2+-exporting ATPase
MRPPVIEVHYLVSGMDCASCALTLERSLSQIPGVEKIQVNFPAATLAASGTFDPEKLAQRVENLGYRLVTPDSDARPGSNPFREQLPQRAGFFHYMLSQRQTAITLLSALLLLLSALFSFLPYSPLTAGLRFAGFLVVIALSGLPIFRKGFRALVYGRQITIDLLMSIATLGALWIGESGEAATVIVLFAIGESLEAYSADKARRSLHSLITLKPDEAKVFRACFDCVEHLGEGGYTGGACPFCDFHPVLVPVEEIRVGEKVLVHPGERIPVDGRIVSGVSTVDQSSVTGEGLPVRKDDGEEVFAGTLNGEGALEIRVSRLAQDSTISRIVRLVDQAQALRAPVERFIDRFAAWYTPLVVAVAAAIAVIPPFIFNQPLLDLPDGTRGWLYRALALLIVACPCALVISTPVTVVSALTGLARRGVLVKGGVFLELLARIRVIALDKTGTLTTGRPTVVQVRTKFCISEQERCESCDEMMALAAAVETQSEHPLAQAVLLEAQNRSLMHHVPAVKAVTSLAGRGVQGEVDGSLVTISSHVYSHDNGHEHPLLHDQIEDAEAAGLTVMLVSRDQEVIGFIGVADLLRQSSRQALVALKKIDPRYRIVMLTGDQPVAAQHIASGVQGLDEIRAGLLPGEKVNVVRDLQSRYGPAVMVGDGVNDAPALAAATVGIAMGGAGTAQAMETADIVLMQDDLTRLPDLILTSRRSRRVIWQNIVFSLGIKIAFMALALPGLTTLWMAVFADMGASLLVTLNGMRMLGDKD